MSRVVFFARAFCITFVGAPWSFETVRRRQVEKAPTDLAEGKCRTEDFGAERPSFTEKPGQAKGLGRRERRKRQGWKISWPERVRKRDDDCNLASGKFHLKKALPGIGWAKENWPNAEVGRFL